MRLYHRIPSLNRIRMLKEVKRVGKSKAILFFGMTNSWLKLRRKLRDKVVSGCHSNPHSGSKKQLLDKLNLVRMRVQDTKWVLPLLADSMVILVTW